MAALRKTRREGSPRGVSTPTLRLRRAPWRLQTELRHDLFQVAPHSPSCLIVVRPQYVGGVEGRHELDPPPVVPLPPQPPHRLVRLEHVLRRRQAEGHDDLRADDFELPLEVRR